MPLTLTKVHVTERIPGSDVSRLVRTNHYVMLKSENEPPLFIQGGQIFSEGGPLVDEIPEWFWIEASKLTPLAIKSCGLEVPPEKIVLPENTTGGTVRRGRR